MFLFNSTMYNTVLNCRSPLTPPHCLVRFWLLLPGHIGLISATHGTEVITTQWRLPSYYCLGHGNANTPTTYHVLNHALDCFQRAYSVGLLPLQPSGLHPTWVKMLSSLLVRIYVPTVERVEVLLPTVSRPPNDFLSPLETVT